MTSTTIYLIAGIQSVTLMVFYSEAHCWQFRVISSGGAVFGEQKLYYSASSDEEAGQGWIRLGR